MEPELWMWVYDGTAHGYYASGVEALTAADDALHWTRRRHVEVVRVKVDQQVEAVRGNGR